MKIYNLWDSANIMEDRNGWFLSITQLLHLQIQMQTVEGQGLVTPDQRQ